MEIIKDLIPKGSINRPGTINRCTHITIHETANTKVGAIAKNHVSYLKTLKEKTSWHYTVDDSSIYQHLPDNEKSYHTSDKTANECSIAIELCVNEDGDYGKTVDNAVWLVRKLMKEYNIPIKYVFQHRTWTGKNCPKKLVNEAWKTFLARCEAEEEDTKKYISIDELQAMGYAGIIF